MKSPVRFYDLNMKTACITVASLLLALPSPALLPEPANIYYGLARDLWGKPLTSADRAVVIVRRNATNEIARTDVFGAGPGQPNFVLRIPLDNGVGAPYSPAAALAGDAVTLVVLINGVEHPAYSVAPPIGSRATVRQLDIMANDDLDRDGMSDSWERWYVGSTCAQPDRDDDGDGQTNLAEFIAGTDPLASDSVTRIEVIPTRPHQAVLNWIHLADTDDVLEWTDSPFHPFEPVPDESLSGVNRNVVNTSDRIVSMFRLQSFGPDGPALRARVLEISPVQPNKVTVECERMPGRQYTLLWSTNMVQPFVPVPANRISGINRSVVEVPADRPTFFRLQVELPR